jgi:hypothetical protein
VRFEALTYLKNCSDLDGELSEQNTGGNTFPIPDH